MIGFGESDKPQKEEYYTIKGFSKFIVDFLESIGLKEDKEQHNNNKKISIVDYSLGRYIAAKVATENKEIIENLVLIGAAGLLKEPTQWLKEYRNAATETNPVTRYEKVRRVLEDMYAGPSRLLPVVVDLFDYTIEKPGAKYAIEVAFDDATSTQIEPERFKKIEDIPCLIIWGEKDNVVMPIKYYGRFRQNLPNAQCEEIADAGHSLIDEKTDLIYEKLRTFLS